MRYSDMINVNEMPKSKSAAHIKFLADVHDGRYDIELDAIAMTMFSEKTTSEDVVNSFLDFMKAVAVEMDRVAELGRIAKNEQK